MGGYAKSIMDCTLPLAGIAYPLGKAADGIRQGESGVKAVVGSRTWPPTSVCATETCYRSAAHVLAVPRWKMVTLDRALARRSSGRPTGKQEWLTYGKGTKVNVFCHNLAAITTAPPPSDIGAQGPGDEEVD